MPQRVNINFFYGSDINKKGLDNVIITNYWNNNLVKLCKMKIILYVLTF